ncbi:MAG: leucine-rich repeat domain-containing protein [Bacillota bacterium]
MRKNFVLLLIGVLLLFLVACASNNAKLNTYTVETEVETGDETGSIILNPYKERYESGDVIDVKADPAEGYKFSQWHNHGFEDNHDAVIENLVIDDDYVIGVSFVHWYAPDFEDINFLYHLNEDETDKSESKKWVFLEGKATDPDGYVEEVIIDWDEDSSSKETISGTGEDIEFDRKINNNFYENPGRYYITITAVDNDGYTNELIKPIVIYDPDKDIKDEIKDDDLKEAIRELFVPDSRQGEGDPIYVDDFADVTIFPDEDNSSVYDIISGISRLDGIEYFFSLEKLDLSGTSLSDEDQFSNSLVPLEFLSETLTELKLYNNGIKNIRSLSYLKKLTYLDLHSNEITKTNSLSELTNLQYLDINTNDISDINALKDLNKLQELILFHNKIRDISSLKELSNLQRLELQYNEKIYDFNPLSNLRNIEFLKLQSTGISDISILENLENLKELLLHNNTINDITSLSNLENLEILGINKINVSDLSPLENLNKLTELHAGGNSIKDISILGELTNLVTLELSNNQIIDISTLSSLNSLKELDLESNEIEDIAPLVNLSSLEKLNLKNNNITMIPSMSNMDSLEVINLSGNDNLQDIDALLDLQDGPIKEIYLINTSVDPEDPVITSLKDNNIEVYLFEDEI